jgi:cysteinyl-tRNA synthetase
VLGISLETSKIPAEIKDMAEKRELFKSSKQFIQSDALRNKILSLGYVVEDTPHGTFVASI